MVVFVFLFVLSWLAATVSGAAGFGGALVLVPVLTSVLGVKAAVPVPTIMQLLGNLSRVWFGRAQIAWKPVGYFLLGALPLAVVGSLLFTGLAADAMTRGVGVLLLVIVILRHFGFTKFITNTTGFLVGGSHGVPIGACRKRRAAWRGFLSGS
jgi:uncharacterized protein